jgi:hypothetical protein
MSPQARGDKCRTSLIRLMLYLSFWLWVLAMPILLLRRSPAVSPYSRDLERLAWRHPPAGLRGGALSERS